MTIEFKNRQPTTLSGVMVNCRPWLFRGDSEMAGLLRRVSFFKNPKVQTMWHMEALATQMVLIGIFLAIVVSIKSLAYLDPNSSFMVTTTHTDDQICVNFTCGGHYCSFSQPKGCSNEIRFLTIAETAEFCNPRMNCNWEAEILVDASYDNRSSSLYIQSDATGRIVYFPQLEDRKRQFVDITKYSSTTSSGFTTIDWSISSDTHSSAMIACGATHPSLAIANSRCGAYNIYFDDTVYSKELKIKYQLEAGVIMFWAFVAIVTNFGVYYGVVTAYGAVKLAEKDVKHKHTD